MQDNDRTFVLSEDILIILKFDKEKQRLIISFIGIPQLDS
jgi:hypothetical protein